MTTNLTPQQLHILQEMASGSRLIYRIGEGWRVGDEPVNAADVCELDAKAYVYGLVGNYALTGFGRRVAMLAEKEGGE